MDVLSEALAMEKAGRLAEALAGYRAALDRAPNDPVIAHRLGFVALCLGRAAEALAALERSLALRDDPEVRIDLGAALRDLGRFQPSMAAYDAALRVLPGSIDAHYGKALSALMGGAPAVAVDHLRAVLAMRADIAEVHDNLGVALQGLDRFGEAVAAHRDAVRLAPGVASMWRNLALALSGAGRAAEAKAAYRSAIAAGGDHVPSWHGLARLALDGGDAASASDAARRQAALAPDDSGAWDVLGQAAAARSHSEEAVRHGMRAVRVAPVDAGPRNNLANALSRVGRLDDAAACFRVALALRPDFPQAVINMAETARLRRDFKGALSSLRALLTRHPITAGAWRVAGLNLMDDFRSAEAAKALRVAIIIEPGATEPYYELGVAESRVGRSVAAVAALTHALSLTPDHGAALAQCIHQRRHLCDWDGLGGLESRLVEGLRAGTITDSPFNLLALSAATAADQLAAARAWAALKARSVDPVPAASRGAGRPPDSRIRVGYLSADFHDHPVAHLVAEVFELHDRERFEITAYSTGLADEGAMRCRIVAGVERFVDLSALSDGAAARRIAADGVDLLVDLQGYTASARTGIMAARPAPIGVNWLGYPGTMGAPYIDYLIADPVVVPEGAEGEFAETVVRLPHCYQPNDRRRPIAPDTPTRAECGLPEDGFVFCCFNSPYKITPAGFALWLRLLKAVEGSVLWVFAREPVAVANLRAVAARAGVAPDRIVLASPLAMDRHLARHRLADLFLDTFPYNAHTTASDALWAGLPVLTMRGATFAGRVAASLTAAAGLPELVTESVTEYEALAIRLAREPGLLAGYRQRLAAERERCPLFDTPRFTRDLEAAYRGMVEGGAGERHPAAAPVSSAAPSGKRLHIVVPYRDREHHLREFIPGVAAFMAERAPDLDYRVTIVEQEPGGPFNRGALKNIGFLLGEATSDYVCLHDVDYVPVDADYSWAETPTPILWYGAEKRPIAPGRTDRTVTTDLESTIGGALLIPNHVFRRIDGYSNAYWGWGFEDFDLSLRIRARNIPIDRRKGAFRPLDHDNEGFNLDGTPAPIARVNRGVFQRLWSGGKIPTGDGASTMDFDTLNREAIPVDGAGAGRWEIVRVRIKLHPTAEQIAACGAIRPEV